MFGISFFPPREIFSLFPGKNVQLMCIQASKSGLKQQIISRFAPFTISVADGPLSFYAAPEPSAAPAPAPANIPATTPIFLGTVTLTCVATDGGSSATASQFQIETSGGNLYVAPQTQCSLVDLLYTTVPKESPWTTCIGANCTSDAPSSHAPSYAPSYALRGLRASLLF